MNIAIELIGVSPLLMHNPRMVDPQYPLNRELKALTGKRVKTDADLEQIGTLEWYGGLYEEDGVVVQPTSKPRKSIVGAGKTERLGKALERTLSFNAVSVPLIYDGPKDIDELFKDKRFHSRLSVGIGGKRVMRVRPQFFPWALRVEGIFITDAGINFDALCRLAELAGQIEGIGDNRINGYGRYKAKVEKL